MIVLLLMTDGRDDYLAETVASIIGNVKGHVSRAVIHDDTGDADHRTMLERLYGCEVIGEDRRLGFGGAYHNAWQYLAATTEVDQARFVFSCEDDFTFNRSVDLPLIARFLDLMPHVAQVALRRQAWNTDEIAAGGVVEQHPDWYLDRHVGPFHWLEHRAYWTTNPSLFRRSLVWRGWPEGDQSEGHFTHQLLEDPETTFAYWGSRKDDPWVTHIGHDRAGTGY